MKMLFKCPCEAASLSAVVDWSFPPFWRQAVPACSEWLCLHCVLPLYKDLLLPFRQTLSQAS